MPSTLVEVCRPCTGTEEVAIIDAVHDSLVAAFKISPDDKHVRLLAYQPHRSSHSPHSARPDRETRVTVDCLSGRSVQAKRQLHREIVDRLEALGIPRQSVSILVRESEFVHNVPGEGGETAVC